MKKSLVLFITVAIFLCGMSTGSVNACQTLTVTSKSILEANRITPNQAILKVAGDLKWKVDWVEVYYAKPQADGETSRRISFVSGATLIETEEVLSFALGAAESDYLHIEYDKELPKGFSGIVKVDSEKGRGARLGFASR